MARVYNASKRRRISGWRVCPFFPTPGPVAPSPTPRVRIIQRTGTETITEPTFTAEQSAKRSLQLALAAARAASENQGRDIVLLDMREITPIFDYFLVVTGSSRRQLHAISEEIDHTLEDELEDRRMGIEGYNESHWILLDYGTVVIHLFDQETREYYALEDFWSAATRVPLPSIDGKSEPGEESGTDASPGVETE